MYWSEMPGVTVKHLDRNKTESDRATEWNARGIWDKLHKVDCRRGMRGAPQDIWITSQAESIRDGM